MIQNAEKFNKNDYLRVLPLLDFTSSLYAKIDLKDTYVICAQHIVSTTYSLFHILLNLGLQPDSLSAIGKCYSTDPQAYEEIKKLGIDACPSSLAFESHRAFDEQYRENIKHFILKRIKKITSSRYKKVIILDDGGELISMINSLQLCKDHFIGIEQTSSGFNKLKKSALDIPIINVARSYAKLHYESPIIARLVVNTFIRHMKSLSLHPKEILIIGNGPIGSHIFEVLKNDYNVSIFDIASSRSSIKKADFESELNKFDMIVGCTGKPVLELKHYSLLKKNVILISASSSDREFNAVNLRIRQQPVFDCHTNLFTDDIHLINCGFPINFDSEYRTIDAEELQLTRSLLLAAILQAQNVHCSGKKEFIPLDIKGQRKIIDQYFSIYRENLLKNKQSNSNIFRDKEASCQ